MTRGERGVYKRGSVYWIDYLDLRGRRHREPVGPSYRVAVQARRQRLADIAHGKFGLRRRGRAMTLQAFADKHWRPEIAPSLSPAYVRSCEANLRNHLLPYFGTWPLATITRADVRAFVAKLRNPEHTLTPKTMKNVIGLLGALLEYAAADYELLEANPLSRHAGTIPPAHP
jgi:integrase-like protein